MEKFKDLKGKVFKNIIVSPDKDEILFITTKGEQYKLYHSQEWSEEVTIEDICGDLKDLIGNEILLAEEINNESNFTP